MDADRLNWIAAIVLDYAYRIHTDLGPGMLESVYCAVLARKLRDHGLKVERQKRIAIVYDGVTYPDAFRADLVVEDAVVVEVKCVSQLAPVHHLQLLTYLRLAGYRLGILINFSEGHLKNGIRRIVNGL